MKLRNSLELILYKAYADLKAEAAQGHLGVLWWGVEPILYMGVFYLFFSVIHDQKSENFIAFLLVALVPWKWFASTVSNGARSIINGAGLMNQVYLPKYIFPCVAMLTNFAKFFVVFLILLTFLLFYGISPVVSWSALPLIILVQFLVIMAVTGLLSAVMPFMPDLRQVIDNALMLLFFLSGILFDIDKAPESIKSYLYFNPMVGLVDAYRAVLVEGIWPEWRYLLVAAALSLLGIIAAKAIIDRFDRVYPKRVMR